MKLELFKEVVDREFEKYHERKFMYVNTLWLFELESERDLYLALKYVNADIDYKTFINKYNWEPYTPSRMEIVIEELYNMDERYELFTFYRNRKIQEEKSIIGIYLSEHDTALYIKISENATTAYSPMYAKFPGDIYDELKIEKKIYSKLNLAETIHKYVKERLEKEGIHL